jgi:hypothetical protein
MMQGHQPQGHQKHPRLPRQLGGHPQNPSHKVPCQTHLMVVMVDAEMAAGVEEEVVVVEVEDLHVETSRTPMMKKPLIAKEMQTALMAITKDPHWLEEQPAHLVHGSLVRQAPESSLEEHLQASINSNSHQH